MEFSNLYFLYLFLPITLLIYFLMPGMRKKNAVLLVASLLFYAMGRLYYLPLLLAVAFGNYWLSWRIVQGKRMTVFLPVILNVVILVLFKALEPSGTFLPLGLSFYTFQLISYQADIYLGKTRPARSFSKLLLYVSMFPKMPMGPIVRYEQVERQLDKRSASPRAGFEGAVRFCVGLAKKVLIADYAYQAYAQLSNQNFGGAAWLGALLFMFYIYFEFSGAADMAIGLGKIFGFRYAENFDLPYAATSITDFWRRWHITLSSFFRDYVYIPLGGNRKGKGRQILNLLAVWLLTGLWHGFHWNYVLWGLYFFVLLSLEKQILPRLERLPFVLRNLMTMLLVLFGWVIFAHESLPEMGSTFALMFGKGDFWNAAVTAVLKNVLPLLALCLIGSSALPRRFGILWRNLLVRGRSEKQISVPQILHAVSLFLFAFLLLYLCTASLAGAASIPSLYANF